jgi:hypothetical protein
VQILAEHKACRSPREVAAVKCIIATVVKEALQDSAYEMLTGQKAPERA